MELAEKIEHIRRCLKLGMDLDSAMLIAECSDEEMGVIKADEMLQRSMKLTSKIFEKDLLEKLNTAMTTNLSFGNTADVKWFLEKINKARWGNNSNIKIEKSPRIVRFIGPGDDEVAEEKVGEVKQTLDDVDALTRSKDLFNEEDEE